MHKYPIMIYVFRKVNNILQKDEEQQYITKLTILLNKKRRNTLFI